MKSLCFKSTQDYRAGVVYNSCPCLCGYQISSDTDHSFRDCDIETVNVFLEKEYAEHFRTVN